MPEDEEKKETPEEKQTAEGAEEKEKPKKKKSRKDRVISKKKHTKVQVWKKYQVEGGKVVRKGKACPRCGVGTFLAEAGNRVYCGKCGYAEIKK